MKMTVLLIFLLAIFAFADDKCKSVRNVGSDYTDISITASDGQKSSILYVRSKDLFNLFTVYYATGEKKIFWFVNEETNEIDIDEYDKNGIIVESSVKKVKDARKFMREIYEKICD